MSEGSKKIGKDKGRSTESIYNRLNEAHKVCFVLYIKKGQRSSITNEKS